MRIKVLDQAAADLIEGLHFYEGQHDRAERPDATSRLTGKSAGVILAA
ncbi:MAG: hypothetical protein ABSH34_30570 [Verrucomicrobiota bacterium]